MAAPWSWPRARSRALALLAAAAGAVLLLWPSLAGAVSTNRVYVIGVVSAAMITAILVLSLNLALGFTGLMSLVHTGLLGIGGYLLAILSVKEGLDAWLALAVAIAGTALCALVVVLVSLRATDLYFGLITLAFNLLIVAVIQQWRSVTGGFSGVAGVPRPSLGGEPLGEAGFYYLVLAALVVAYLVQRNLVLSPWGRAFRAVRESPDTGASLGIDVNAARVLSFTVAGALAGLSGGLYAAQLNFISADSATTASGLALFIALFLGGVGTFLGPLLGVLVVTIINQLIKDLGAYTQLALGVILLAAMFLLPQGVVGAWRSSRLGQEPEEPRPEGDAAEAAASPPPAAAGRAGEVALCARGIAKSFGGVRALDGVELTLRYGEVHGIIGPNGAGKSTLVACLSGHLRPDAGAVAIDGAPAPARPHRVARRGVGRVFQVPHLFETVSVLDNVLTGMFKRSDRNVVGALLRLPGFRRRERAQRAQAGQLLRLAGLGGRDRRLASGLSHGQKRLLEVARVLASAPRILILDEPATGLTRLELRQLRDVIERLRDAGLAVALIEHNVEFVMGLCDRITVLHYGEVIASGPPGEVRTSPAVQEAYLGRRPPAAPVGAG
jgi:ABC-type branched-subunit amino acid transport system ATPase component/ABC-type branched-subunit amino acid transport system permease subunit